MDDLTQYKFLSESLKSSGHDAQVWHSGGGIFGVLVKLPNEHELFFGDAEGDNKWGFDHMGADWNHIDSVDMFDQNESKLSVAEWATGVINKINNNALYGEIYSALGDECVCGGVILKCSDGRRVIGEDGCCSNLEDGQVCHRPMMERLLKALTN